MFKKAISTFLAVVMALSCLTTVALADYAGEPVTIEVTSDQTSVQEGKDFTLTVTLKQAVQKLGNLYMTMDYDETKVTFVSATAGDLGLNAEDIEDAGNKYVKYTWDTDTAGVDYEANSTVFTVTFTANEGVGTQANIAPELTVDDGGFADATFEQFDIPYTVQNATVAVTAPIVSVESVTLNKDTLSLTAGGHETLTATVNPDNATNKAVTWSSDNEAVATVSSSGEVTGVKKGTATITVKTADGDFTATCTVTVENAPCTHSEKIDHPAKDSTCKDKGWDAYAECKECGQLFDKDGNEIDGIPYRALSTTHTPAQTATEEYLKTPATCTSAAVYYERCSVCGKKLDTTFTSGGLKAHTESGWKMDSTGHWKICTECSHVTTEKVAHTPDHEGHATEAYAIKCTVCGYEIEAQLAHTHHLTLVPAKAATCTEAGNKAYYTCSGCDNWYEDAEGNTLIADHDSVKLAALNHDWKPATCTEPKTCQRPGCGATEGAALGHDPGEEWKSDEYNHWHICTRCNEKVTETVGRHNPDRDAATVNDPILCRDCGYEMAPKLPTVTVELPFTVTVKQGGNVAPGKQAFELELFNIGNSNESDYADVKITATVETDGKGDYTAKLVISGSEEQVNALISEGFYVREKNTKAEGWTYSDAVWHVVFEDSIPTVYPTTMETTDNGVNYEDGEAVENNTMTFVNTYTVNETPKPTPDTPKTGDGSMMGLSIALVIVSGAALMGTALYSRRKSR